MLKVGMFVDTYFPMIDGVINVVHNYSKRIQGDEFEVIVFCPKLNKKYIDDFPYRVVRCKSVKIFFLDYSLPLPKLDRKFKRILKGSQLDIVHIHSPFGIGKMGLWYAKKHHIPVIASLHSQFEQDFYRATHSKSVTKSMLKVVTKVYNQCDACFAVNERVAEIFHGYGVKKMPGVVFNCTDLTPVEDGAAANRLVNETYSLKEDQPVFLFVGRITALKNIYLIVDALAQLKDMDFKMLFVGSGQDEAELLRRVEKNGLTEKVVMTGRISDREMLKALYHRANLFLFPSVYDTNSLVQIEAASQKTPTLFGEGTATSFLVKNNVNGFIAPLDATGYAERLREILSDKETYDKVCDGAHRDLYFVWEHSVEQIKQIYRDLIAEYQNKKEEN